VDLASAELRKQGTLLRVQEQPFQILCALLERPGEVVTREDLVGRLWADGTVVDYDRGLNAAVNRLRQVLSDSAESPRYVETVARRGYRFVAPVEDGSPPVAAQAAKSKAIAFRLWATGRLMGARSTSSQLGMARCKPGRFPRREEPKSWSPQAEGMWRANRSTAISTIREPAAADISPCFRGGKPTRDSAATPLQRRTPVHN